jgi:two-component system, OmpR family, heavy metal sensor histidine kinase CusS
MIRKATATPPGDFEIRRTSLTLRLALYCALFAGTMVGAALGWSYWELSTALRERVHAELLGERELVRHALSAVSLTILAQGDAYETGALRIDHPGLSVAVFPAEGAAPYAVLGVQGRDLSTLASARDWSGVAEIKSEPHSFAAVIDQTATADGNRVRLAVSLDRTADQALVSAHLRRLTAVWVFSVFLIGGLAGIIAHRSLAPLRRFSSEVSAVSAAHLGRRVDDTNLPKELWDLAVTFNRLLSNLDQAFHRLNEFSSDIAHELRSPLANLVGKTQVTLARSRTTDEYKQALESNAGELERMTRMVTDMLFLARAEHTSATQAWVAASLYELCLGVAEFYEIVAQERGIRITVSGHAEVRADRDLIQRAVANLLSNAIRHTPDGGAIAIRIKGVVRQHTLIEVENPGPGIPAELQARLFERFMRGDPSRQRSGDAAGTGLGLAIVRSIMDLHRGTVEVRNRPEGPTVFTLRFGG